MFQSIEISEANRPDPRGKKRIYPAAMCPFCEKFNTRHNTKNAYRCNECKKTFTVDTQGEQITRSKTAVRKPQTALERGYTIKEVREYFDNLEGTIRQVPEYSRRPVCGTCGEKVTGRSFYHRSLGTKRDVICHKCVRGTGTRKLFQ